VQPDVTRWLVELWRPGRAPRAVERLEGPLEREHRCRAAYRDLGIVLTVSPLGEGASRLEILLRAEEREADACVSLRGDPAAARGEIVLPEGRLEETDRPLVALAADGDALVAAVGESALPDFRPPDPAPLGERGGPAFRSVRPGAPVVLLAHFLRLPRAAPDALPAAAGERLRRLHRALRC
jgi:hypothetical protein